MCRGAGEDAVHARHDAGHSDVGPNSGVESSVATLSTQPNDFVLAFYSILKGAVEGVKALSTAQASLDHADLKSLFLQLQQFLFYGHGPFQVETLQILSVLVASVSLDPVCSASAPQE